MDKYVCDVCGYVYDPAVGDPDNGIDPGTSFDQLPENWVCPLCGVGKDMFSSLTYLHGIEKPMEVSLEGACFRRYRRLLSGCEAPVF